MRYNGANAYINRAIYFTSGTAIFCLLLEIRAERRISVYAAAEQDDLFKSCREQGRRH